MDSTQDKEHTQDVGTPVVHPHVPFPLPAHHVFGGFWIRLAAMTIDYVLMLIPCALAGALIIILAVMEIDAGMVGILSVLLMLLALAWTFGYFIVFYGVKSTTPGKMLFGMRVVREDNGSKMSWGQAFGRTFAYILSRIFYIGFIIAAFDDEKRALHDHLAKTRVIRDTRKPTTAGWVLFSIIVSIGVAACVFVISLVPVSEIVDYEDQGFNMDSYQEIVDEEDFGT